MVNDSRISAIFNDPYYKCYMANNELVLAEIRFVLARLKQKKIEQRNERLFQRFSRKLERADNGA